MAGDESIPDVFAYLNVQFHKRTVNLRLSFILQNEVSKRVGCRTHWGTANGTTNDWINSYRLWPRRNLNRFVDIKTMYDPDNVLGCAYTDRILSGGKSGSIVLVENGTVTTVLGIDDDEEMSPIALMALPPHSAHPEGAVIPVVNGEVAPSLDVVAEC